MANVSEESSRSLWMDLEPPISAARLQSDIACDVIVIGAGIAGLSTAYELTRFGYSVAVIDRGPIGGGMTARSTAHLASALDDYYSELIKVHGEETARRYHESQVAAINRIEAICADETIDASFARVDGVLIPASSGDQRQLEAEFEACRKIDVDVEWTENPLVDRRALGGCLRFARQGRVNPARYVAALSRAIASRGGRLFAETAYIGHETRGDRVLVQTEAGPRIDAAHAVFTTNSPVNGKVSIHGRQAPFRTYALAGKVPKGSVADVLLWDTLDVYHYVRIQPADGTSDYLIVGGEDHRTGQETDMARRLAAIEAWARDRYPALGAVQYRWSGQVLESADFMPFTGRNPGDRNVYIHTGDSGQGITNGVLASLVIAPLICGQDARFAAVVDPGRKPVGLPAEQAAAGRNPAGHADPREAASVDDIAAGSGAILRQGSSNKLAAYRNEAGGLSFCSAACTHAGCTVQWNPFEKCWDCPCHGSQFAPDGRVLNGPALRALPAESQAP